MINCKHTYKRILLVVCALILLTSCNGELNIGKVGFTVNFYCNGKEVSPSQTVQYGQTLIEPEIPEKPADDMYFVGWFNGDSKWNFSNGVADNMQLTAKFDLIALKFESKSSFKITPKFASGVKLTYSLDKGDSWNTCTDGTEIEVADAVYFRGSGNSVITGDLATLRNWVIVSDNGKNGVRCSGNIETLLDWETVVRGEHPTMGPNCFFGLFKDCICLLTPPELPATTLSMFCYAYMFQNCINLRTLPVLPQVGLYAMQCYSGMFADCPNLCFVTWKTNSEPFFISGEGMEMFAAYMLDGKTPKDNTAYYYVAY